MDVRFVPQADICIAAKMKAEQEKAPARSRGQEGSYPRGTSDGLAYPEKQAFHNSEKRAGYNPRPISPSWRIREALEAAEQAGPPLPAVKDRAS